MKSENKPPGVSLVNFTMQCLETLIPTNPVKTLPSFYTTWSLTILFTKPQHFILLWSDSMQPTPSHPVASN